MNDSNTIYISHSDDMTPDIIPVPSTTDSTLSKKVAQNRAAQRAFRERKQHYVEDLENKAKQLDECKRAMIQLQADNECLRKSVARLESQLKATLPPMPPLPKKLPLPPYAPSISVLQIKPTTSSSKREKKRQRLLADEKLHKNDDLEPIQLHCPSTQQPVLSDAFLRPHDPNPIRFLQLLPTDNVQDQYIQFVEDNKPPSQ